MSEAEFAALAGLFGRRHSCRAFLRDPVPRETIARLLAVAQRTASWCNTQPWQVVVTRGEATERLRDALMARAGQPACRDIGPEPRYEGVSLERRRACGFQLYDSVGIARGDRAASARQAAENLRLFGAPHVAIVSTEAALGPYGAIDCGGFVASFLLVAESLGIASIAQAALAGHAAFIRAHFGLPETRRIVCGIAFGYEDRDHPANGFRTARAGLEEVVDWRG
jgi:nitroreductase